MGATTVIRNNYMDMSSATKMTMILGLVFSLSFFVWGMFIFMKDTYAVLFTDMEPNDASSVISELDKNKIKYKLENDGRTILVNEDIVHRTRLQVANNVSMLNGGIGFEIFDKDDFGTTEFAQKTNYQRALQGELARTIMALSEVKMARVHLVLPESSLFSRKESTSRASVTVILKDGAKLSDAQVSGIQKLVASSTPGLKANDVTILNQQGITLAVDEEEEHSFILSSKKLERKKEIEEYLTFKAQELLDKTFGINATFVTIDVLMDFDNIKVTREQVIAPDKDGVNISKKKEVSVQDNKKEKNDSSRSTVEIDYQLSKQIEQIVSTPGSIKRLSVAIVVPEELGERRIEYLEDMVGNAVGYNKARGDMIAVSSKMSNTIVNVELSSEKGSLTSPKTPEIAQSEITKDSLLDELTNNNKVSMPDVSDIAITDVNIFGFEHKYLTWAVNKTQQYLKVMYEKPHYVLLILMVLMMFLFIYTIASRLISKSNITKKKALSKDEKEEYLLELKNWLAADK